MPNLDNLDGIADIKFHDMLCRYLCGQLYVAGCSQGRYHWYHTKYLAAADSSQIIMHQLCNIYE